MTQQHCGPAAAPSAISAVSNPDNKELTIKQVPNPTNQPPLTGDQEHRTGPIFWDGRVIGHQNDPVMTMQHPLPLSTLLVPADLQRYCELANSAAWEDCEDRNTCISTSQALLHFLHQRGYKDARLVRIELAVLAEDRDNGAARVGGGRRSSGPDMWAGHLDVQVDGYLLDPTIDQVNHRLRNVTPMAPLVVRLPQWWDSYEAAFYIDADNTIIRYAKDYRQNGWKSAPDSRRSSWAPVLQIMIREADAELGMADNSDRAAA